MVDKIEYAEKLRDMGVYMGVGHSSFSQFTIIGHNGFLFSTDKSTSPYGEYYRGSQEKYPVLIQYNVNNE